MNRFYYFNGLLKYQQSRRLSSSIDSLSKWKSVIGLEIHAQLQSQSKLFSGAAVDYNTTVNSNVSLFDGSMPGTMPVLNKNCVNAAVKTAVALSCNMNTISHFDRKHYFYADMPSGYQITQQRLPLAYGGQLMFPVYTPGIHKSPYNKISKIKQLQLEQDSGKSIYDDNNFYSLVDLNRAGVPLIEIVFEPDIEDAEEAAALIKELSLILQRLGTCSCKMEEGALRVDANISVNKLCEPLGIKTEIKNIGSIRGVASAIKYEITRQILILEAGGNIINETRSWDAQKRRTVAMRDKEILQDYRYMPEPNLPPLHLRKCIKLDDINTETWINTLPELPGATRAKLVEKHKISFIQALILVSNPILLSRFEKITTNEKNNPKIVANFLINEYLTIINKCKLNIENVKISSQYLAEIIELIQSKTINILIARQILEEMLRNNTLSPKQIIEIKNWGLIKNENDINALCKDAIIKNPKIVQQYKIGKKKVFNALLGKIAIASNNRANMEKISHALRKMLD